MAERGDAVILRPGEGRTFPMGGRSIAVKADATPHAPFAAFESTPLPGEPGPPPHRHHTYDEAFYVLDGAIEFRVDDRAVTLGAGGFVHVPPGVAHTFRNPGPEPARMLVVVAPPEALILVERLGALSADGPPDPAVVRALFAEHRSEIIGPPG